MEKEINEGLVFSYDKTSDILYLSIGEPQEGIDEEVEEGIFVRLNPKTKIPNGIMIMDFEKRFSNNKTKPLPLKIENISYTGT